MDPGRLLARSRFPHSLVAAAVVAVIAVVVLLLIAPVSGAGVSVTLTPPGVALLRELTEDVEALALLEVSLLFPLLCNLLSRLL